MPVFCATRLKSGRHDEIMAAVYRSQADALEIESLAKRRLADEYYAAQDRGEVRGANTGRSVSALETPSDDMGFFRAKS